MKDEIDVVGCSPSISPQPSDEEEEKKYYCQRCLNHGKQFPRKGHKPKCLFLNCTCSQCSMVEQRRQLNNMLSRSRKVAGPAAGPADQQKGPRVRDPQCARCGAHGVKIPLRGHKRSMCQFSNCTCNLCDLVENRRTLMAKQIKLRRVQQKDRGGGSACNKPPKKLDRSRSSCDAPSSSASSTTPHDDISPPPPQILQPPIMLFQPTPPPAAIPPPPQNLALQMLLSGFCGGGGGVPLLQPHNIELMCQILHQQLINIPPRH